MRYRSGDSRAWPQKNKYGTNAPMSLTKIRVRGAREHNLKGVDIDLPRDTFIVITGLSGSGKSSLAFDTIYAEASGVTSRAFLPMRGSSWR